MEAALSNKAYGELERVIEAIPDYVHKPEVFFVEQKAQLNSTLLDEFASNLYKNIDEVRDVFNLIDDVTHLFLTYEAGYSELETRFQRELYFAETKDSLDSTLNTQNISEVYAERIIGIINEKIDEVTQRIEDSHVYTSDAILKELHERKIPLWEDRDESDNRKSIQFYQDNYADFEGRIFQFIVREYDPKLFRAIESRVAYLRRKGEDVAIKDVIPPKGEYNNMLLANADPEEVVKYANISSAIARRERK